MRIAARVLVVAVALILLTAGSLVAYDALRGGSAQSERDESSTVAAPAASETGTLTMLPSVSQPGNGTARPGGAEAAFTARFDAEEQVSLVLLERKTPAGWHPVGSARPDARGIARLTAQAARQGHFRATALTGDGARGATTNEVTAGGWKLVFEDPFDGTSLDTSKWGYRQLGRYNENGSRVCSKSDERAVSVSEGTLKLQVMQDPDRVGEPCYAEDGTFDYYLNGHVATEGIYEFKYGVASARVKFPQGRGQHGAFWLQREGIEEIAGNPKRSGAEIDVVEFFGDDYPGGGLASFLYYLNKQGENEKVGGIWPKATKQLPPGDDWWRSYHVFSVEWTPQRYVFRVDGREIFRTREGVSGVEQFLILSLLSSDWELPHLDESTLPTTMEVDWVRVWQRRGGNPS